jgi:DNA-binding MarR family transcriptional regulator
MATKQATERDSVDKFMDARAAQLPDIDLDVEAAVHRIQRIVKSVKRSMEETLKEYDISHGEWGILGNLRLAGPPYRSSPGQLAKDEWLSSGAMTNRLDRLEEAGLVKRLPDPDDRRALLVELTEKGHELWLESVGVQASKEAAIAAALSRRELKELNTLLRKVLLEFERKPGS